MTTDLEKMTVKETKDYALKILNRKKDSGLKKSDFTVRQARAIIREYEKGWLD